MPEQTLIEEIEMAQNQRDVALIKILDKFKPLIYKYSGLLQYEDVQNDLEYFLIQIILKLKIEQFKELGDVAILSYLKKSMYHYYIFLSKRKSLEQKTSFFGDLNECELAKVEYMVSPDEPLNALLIADLKKLLNKHEFEVIYLHFFEKYTIEEIAKHFSCSRQAINQTKKRALGKLSNHYRRNEN